MEAGLAGVIDDRMNPFFGNGGEMCTHACTLPKKSPPNDTIQHRKKCLCIVKKLEST